MKKLITNFAFLVLGIACSSQAFSQTSGTLTFNFTEVSKSTGQTYGSLGKHVLAVWIQANSGTFTKSRMRYAANGTADHLPTWAVNSGGTSGNCMATACNKVGATTGASLSSFAARSFTWDGTDATAVVGALVPDGIYKVTIEETWNHGTTATAVRSFTFTKGPNSDIQSPTADANFSGISLQWIPTAVPAPTASFTTSASTVCVGQSVQLTSTSTGSPTSYAWTMTGGTPASSTSQNPTVTYSAAGTYTVSLTATNSGGSSTPSTQTINVTAAPTVTNTTPGSVCGSGTVTLSATASSGTIVWYSSATGGTALATGSSFTTPSISTTTTYYAEAYSSSSCTSPTRTAVTATVTPGPTVTSSTPGSHCGQGTVMFGATASAGTLSWFSSATGGTALGTGTSFTTPSIASTTTYYVEANTGNCPSTRTAVTATINPVPTVTNPGNSTLCVNANSSPINFSGSSSSSVYAWTNDNASIGLAAGGTGNIQSFTALAAGVANVSVIPTLNGCIGTAVNFMITVNNLPTVILSNFPAVCISDPAFALSGGTPAGGVYSGQGVTNNTFTPSVAGVGVHTISYYVTQNGCSNSTTVTIQVDACSGISELNSKLLLVYPNPTNGVLNFKGNDLLNYKNVELIDLSGKIVGSWQVVNSSMTIDISGQPAGFYNLKFFGNGTESIHKIEIKK